MRDQSHLLITMKRAQICVLFFCLSFLLSNCTLSKKDKKSKNKTAKKLQEEVSNVCVHSMDSEVFPPSSLSSKTGLGGLRDWLSCLNQECATYRRIFKSTSAAQCTTGLVSPLLVLCRPTM